MECFKLLANVTRCIPAFVSYASTSVAHTFVLSYLDHKTITSTHTLRKLAFTMAIYCFTDEEHNICNYEKMDILFTTAMSFFFTSGNEHSM